MMSTHQQRIDALLSPLREKVLSSVTRIDRDDALSKLAAERTRLAGLSPAAVEAEHGARFPTVVARTDVGSRFTTDANDIDPVEAARLKRDRELGHARQPRADGVDPIEAARIKRDAERRTMATTPVAAPRADDKQAAPHVHAGVDPVEAARLKRDADRKAGKL
jgi:hypothetical protein